MRDDGREAPGSFPHVRTSPTGRVPQWVFDEAVGAAAPAVQWRAWSPAEIPGRRGHRSRTLLAFLLIAALVVTGLLLQRAGVAAPGSAADSGLPGFPHPPAGIEETGHRLGTPPASPAGGGPHAFIAMQSGGRAPVTYDPCRPIHYVVRPDNSPSRGQQVIDDAVARVSQVTGLRFIYDGTTEEPATKNRALYQPERYGKRWAPVLISWDTTIEDPALATDVAGEGGSAEVTVPGASPVFVTGSVALDAAQFAHLLPRPGGIAVARAIVLHELGHVVGLAHVADPTQLMYPTVSPGVVDFEAGDLTGLAELGAGSCVPEV